MVNKGDKVGNLALSYRRFLFNNAPASIASKNWLRRRRCTFLAIKKIMKIIPKIIVVTILFLGCDSKEIDLQKMWIGKYRIYNVNKEGKSIGKVPERVLAFENDTVQFKDLSFDYLTDTNKTKSFKYSLSGDWLIVFVENRIDSTYCKISKDSLVLKFNRRIQEEAVYWKLKKYRLAQNEDDFYNYLVTSSFEISDSIRVEFGEDSSIIVSDLNFRIGDNQYWRIEKFKDELFLLTDGLSGFTIHLMEFNHSGFTGVIYGIENKEVKFKKLSKGRAFQIENLIGEWEENRDENIPPPPQPPTINKNKAYFEKEFLLITDSTIQKYKFYRIDTLEWKSNRENDLIIFAESRLPIKERQWQIKLLNKNELVIGRKSKMMNYHGNQMEIIKFKRK